MSASAVSQVPNAVVYSNPYIVLNAEFPIDKLPRMLLAKKIGKRYAGLDSCLHHFFFYINFKFTN